MTDTAAELTKGYLLHFCNIGLCIHLYLSQISEWPKLNLHMSALFTSKNKCDFISESKLIGAK